jgi:hypothetical protein
MFRGADSPITIRTADTLKGYGRDGTPSLDPSSHALTFYSGYSRFTSAEFGSLSSITDMLKSTDPRICKVAAETLEEYAKDGTLLCGASSLKFLLALNYYHR